MCPDWDPLGYGDRPVHTAPLPRRPWRPEHFPFTEGKGRGGRTRAGGHRVRSHAEAISQGSEGDSCPRNQEESLNKSPQHPGKLTSDRGSH